MAIGTLHECNIIEAPALSKCLPCFAFQLPKIVFIFSAGLHASARVQVFDWENCVSGCERRCLSVWGVRYVWRSSSDLLAASATSLLIAVCTHTHRDTHTHNHMPSGFKVLRLNRPIYYQFPCDAGGAHGAMCPEKLHTRRRPRSTDCRRSTGPSPREVV